MLDPWRQAALYERTKSMYKKYANDRLEKKAKIKKIHH